MSLAKVRVAGSSPGVRSKAVLRGSFRLGDVHIPTTPSRQRRPDNAIPTTPAATRERERGVPPGGTPRHAPLVKGPVHEERMVPEPQEHKGRRVEVQTPDSDEQVLLVDGEPVPYGRLPDGQYFLREYAYDWSDDLMELATRWIDYRDRADAARRAAERR
jgi:hypothetical protein